jgi:hypothetical protein
MIDWLISAGCVLAIAAEIWWVTAPIRVARKLIREGWEPPSRDASANVP